MKRPINYQVGVLKRRLNMGKKDFEPGAMINKAKKVAEESNSKQPKLSKHDVAIRGLV